MRKLLVLITIVSGLAACLALYASLAFVTSGRDTAAGYAMLMLLAMLAVTLLFACAADNAAPYRRAHRRRIRAMRKRLAFDRVRHGITLAMLLALATGSFAVPASARTSAAHHSPTRTTHAAHSASATHAATHASLTHVAASLPHYAMPRTKR